MLPVKITVQLTKSTAQVTLWGIWQARPYPRILGYSGSILNWQDEGALFYSCGNPPKGLPESYGAALLRPDWTPDNATGNRQDFAGYVPYRETVATPGTIVYRGRDLGEIPNVSIDPRPAGIGHGAGFRVRGNDVPTPGERAFLTAQVAPALLLAVAAHRAELRAEAIAAVKDYIAEQLRETGARLVTLEQEAKSALATLA